MTNKTRKGILFSLVTALVSGLAIFYNKQVITKGLDPLTFNILKNGGVALILSVPVFFQLKKNIVHLKGKKLLKLLSVSLIGGSIPFLLFFEGLRRIPAINANIIHKTLFIWVAIMAIRFLGEKISSWQIVGYIIVVLSNFFLGGFTGFSFTLGEIMIFAATLLWSLENIIAKKLLKDTPVFLVSFSRMFFGSLVLIIFAGMQNKAPVMSSLNTSQALPILGSIFLLSLYVISWYHALKYAPATIVTSILVLSTPITSLLTILLVNRSLPFSSANHLLTTSFGVFMILLFFTRSQNTRKKPVSINP